MIGCTSREELNKFEKIDDQRVYDSPAGVGQQPGRPVK